MKTYYLTAEDQYGQGAILGVKDGTTIYAGGEHSYLFDIETRVSNSIVAKAMDTGCIVKSSMDKILVMFKAGSDEGKAFHDRLAEGYAKSELVSSHEDNGMVFYKFSKPYALGR